MKINNLAIVTGAGRGIGARISRQLMEDGFRVIGFDRSWSQSNADGPEDRISVDVSDYGAVKTAIASIEASRGPIGVIVNNAGITRDAMSHKMDPADFRLLLEVNLLGPFHLCRAVLPCMREQGFGRIINISSMNALRGQAGQANYAAAKAGLIAMTKSIALENASKGITANCVAPGFIASAMTDAMRPDIRDSEIAKIPVARIGQPQDVANVVSFLASDRADFVTGQILSVNGGQYM